MNVVSFPTVSHDGVTLSERNDDRWESRTLDLPTDLPFCLLFVEPVLSMTLESTLFGIRYRVRSWGNSCKELVGLTVRFHIMHLIT